MQGMKARAITFFYRLLSLIALCLSMGCDRYEVVIDDLSQQDAIEVLVMLREHDIDARKASHSNKKGAIYQIEVKQKQANLALRLLVHNQLPKVHRAGLKDVYPPGASGIIPSKTDEQARMTMAMQGEIEALLKVIPGIRDARVVVSSDVSPDHRSSIKTASVVILNYPKAEHSGSILTDDEVKNLIVTSIAGLSKDSVNVVQRQIDPVLALQKQDQSKLDLPVIIRERTTRPSWYLMALTLLALAIAAYAVIRMMQERRTLSKPSA